jgi:hypothetical protein
MNHDRPGHPCDLVGESNCRHLCRSTIHYSYEPRSFGAVLSALSAIRRASSFVSSLAAESPVWLVLEIDEGQAASGVDPHKQTFDLRYQNNSDVPAVGGGSGWRFQRLTFPSGRQQLEDGLRAAITAIAPAASRYSPQSAAPHVW